MMDREHAVFTQTNNVVNTLNVLFAMRDVRARRPPGEARHDGRVRHARTSTSRRASSRSSTTGASDTCPFPKLPGCFYHLSKVHDSHNIHFACRIWGLRATDLNQGVVYGIETEETALDDRLAHAVRLRRGVRHRAEPLLRPGRDRPPAHRVRQGRADARLPEHRRHAAVRRARRAATRRTPASSASSTSSPSSSRCWSWRSTCRRPARRSAWTSSCIRSTTRGSSWRSTTTTPTHTKLLDLGLRAAPALRDPDRVDVRGDRAPPGPRDPRPHPAAGSLAPGRGRAQRVAAHAGAPDPRRPGRTRVLRRRRSCGTADGTSAG